MSKKEEKAKEYVNNLWNNGIIDSSKEFDNVWDSFEAGWDAALGNQWISVKDTLPDVGISVLVLTSNSKVSMSKIYQPKDCHGNDTGIIRWSGSSTFDNSIVAWMSIPSFDEILQANKDVLKRLKDK